MQVEFLCRFCGQRARADASEVDVLIDGYPHRLNGVDEPEPLACDLEVEVSVIDRDAIPQSTFLPTPTKRQRIICRENVKDAFPHHHTR